MQLITNDLGLLLKCMLIFCGIDMSLPLTQVNKAGEMSGLLSGIDVGY